MTGPTGRAVLLVTAGNLLPLVFVATGTLDLPLLLVCYGIEAVLLPGCPGSPRWEDLKLRLAAAGIVVVLLARALFAIEWSPGTLAVLACTVVLTLAGQWFARRDPGSADVAGGIGAVTWRVLLIFMGGVLALSYAEDLTTLTAASWTPGPVGDLVATYPAWAFNEIVFALGLAPLTAAALVFVLFKAVNEALWTAYRSLSPARPVRRSRSRTAA